MSLFDGKPVLSQLEPDILKQLAAQERGQYYMAGEWNSLGFPRWRTYGKNQRR